MSLRDKTVAVVVPAYAEAAHIHGVLRGMPSWVDHIVVVDDASPDTTAQVVAELALPKVRLLSHSRNLGVGAAIASGYDAALLMGADVIAVMAGDGQMDPEDLLAVVTPVLDGDVDYVKGNRFVHARARDMPMLRRLGSGALSMWTRRLTGLVISDTQCGFTAIAASAAKSMPLNELWPRYGYPNDLLGMLAARGLRVSDVPVRPVYAGEASGLRAWHPLLIGWVALRRHLRDRRERQPLGSTGTA